MMSGVALDPRRPGAAADRPLSDLFVDRQTESAALADAVAAHRARVRADTVDGTTLRNVLTFYGVSGVGKSSLSARLQSWLEGALPADSEWGPPPEGGSPITVRWDLNDSTGNLDALVLLLPLRDALHRVAASWPAFDLAFAAYLSAVRPGEPPVEFGARRGTVSGNVLGYLAEIAKDVGTELDLMGTNIAATVTSSVVGRLISIIDRARTRASAVGIGPETIALAERALTASPGQQDPDLIADLLWQVSLQIDRRDPQERPEVVVFVDHFERMQSAETRQGEILLNQMIASLPHVLFVITGQNEVDWHRADRVALPTRGPETWPGLVPGTTDHPRQHRIGHLSDGDTALALRTARERERLRVSDVTIEALVATIQGWPVHMDAVLAYARDLAAREEREITIDDLGGPLTDVVRRLMSGLPADERRALQAECALPFFDVELATSISSAVDEGAVLRTIRRAVVMANEGSAYPYRIHDSIRAAVRRAGHDVDGGWSERDWAAAADRAMAHAAARSDRAKELGDDVGQLSAIALGLHLGVEHEVDGAWIADALRRAPGITALAPMIPPSRRLDRNPELRAIAEFVEAMAGPDDDAIGELDRISHTDSGIAASAGLWKAYRLRNRFFRFDAAVAQLRDLRTRFPDHDALYARQIAITFSQGRRFRDALEALDDLDADTAASTRLDIGRSLGRLEEGLESLRARIERVAGNRRYQLELLGTLTLQRARLGLASSSEVAELRRQAIAVDHRVAEREAIRAAALADLGSESALDEALARLRQLRLGGPTSPAEVELAALFASLTGDTGRIWPLLDEYVLELPVRPAVWIFTEVLLEQLGFNLPPVATQLPDGEDPDAVRDRWLTVAEGIVRRNRRAAG